MNENKNLVSVTWANWLNILPDLRGKAVLKIGTDNLDGIVTISYGGAKSLCCIGESRIELKDIVTKYYASIDACSEDRFDVVIMDEFLSFVSQNNFQVSEVTSKIINLLSETGTLLIGCSNGWRNVKYRRIINAELLKRSPTNVGYYFCDPSIGKPFSIIPFVDNNEWLTENFPNVKEGPYRKNVILKEWVKSTLFKAFGILNPLRSLAFVFDKSSSKQEPGLDIGQIDTGIESRTRNKSSVKVCITNYYLKKHYLFEYSKTDKTLLQIEKIGYQAPGNRGPLENEYRNMLLFEGILDDFKNNDIEIIQPLCFYSKTRELTSLSMTVVQGQSLLYLLEKNLYFRNYKEVVNLLNKATDVQICFQKLCEKNIPDKLNTLSADYSLNYMGLNINELTEGARCIQHGDYAANNIILNIDNGSWGIIDWEWLNRGFPPLLDIFSLYTSLRFTPGKKKYDDAYDRYYDSFIATFFSNNWLSQNLLINLNKYCQSFNFQTKDIYTYLLHFLIFHCNKFRIFEYEQQQLYEEMLKYAVKNEKDFVSHQIIKGQNDK